MAETKYTDIDFKKLKKIEPDWHFNFRKNSWNTFNQAPMPDRVVHLWKYTDPNNFIPIKPENLIADYSKIENKTETDQSLLKDNFAGFGINAPDMTTSTAVIPSLAEEGVIIEDLKTAMTEHADLVGNHIGHLVGADFGKFESLNSALWNSGLFVYIPDHTTIDKPIRLERNPAGAETYHRLLVIVGKNAQATIIDDYYGDIKLDKGMVNSVVEIFVGDSSNVKFANIQRHSKKMTVYTTLRARLGQEANYVSTFAGMGGSLSKTNAGSFLAGSGADSRMYGFVFADKKQHFDYHTRHHHQQSNSYSNIDFKVILKDEATSAYTGLIKIDEKANDCQAFQENRNLLLNQGPKAESIPELEILTDQVSCSHGATMGPIDPEMVFYLQSRGYSRENAVKSIVTGFIESTISLLPDDLRDLMRGLVENKLEAN